MDWEEYGIRTLDTVTQTGARIAEQWSGVFASREQFEAQLDAYERLSRIPPRPAAAGLPPLAILMVGAVLVLLFVKKG